MTTRREVYRALDSERDYQDDKFEGSRSAIDRTLDEFILYICQYADEAAELTTHGNEAEALHFVRKVGALCVGCMERHGAPRRAWAQEHGFERFLGLSARDKARLAMGTVDLEDAIVAALEAQDREPTNGRPLDFRDRMLAEEVVVGDGC